jgi:hypothetical protein
LVAGGLFLVVMRVYFRRVMSRVIVVVPADPEADEP